MSFEDRGRAGITASSHCFGELHQLLADHLAITYEVAPQSSAKPLTNRLFCGKLIKFALQICFANLLCKFGLSPDTWAKGQTSVLCRVLVCNFCY